jgi:anti-anti-sigma regulatory factor
MHALGVGECRHDRAIKRSPHAGHDPSQPAAQRARADPQGDVDATNHRALARYVEGRIAGRPRLEVDLRLVDFFGTAGFAVLHNINVICCRYDATWVLRAGRQLRRLLAVCDPDGSLPLEEPQSVLDDIHASARDRELLIGRNN